MQASAFPVPPWRDCGVSEQFNKTVLVPYMRKIPRPAVAGLRGASTIATLARATCSKKTIPPDQGCEPASRRALYAPFFSQLKKNFRETQYTYESPTPRIAGPGFFRHASGRKSAICQIKGRISLPITVGRLDTYCFEPSRSSAAPGLSGPSDKASRSSIAGSYSGSTTSDSSNHCLASSRRP